MATRNASSHSEVWQAGKCPNGFWSVAANRRAYMDWISKRLGLEKDEDWYNVLRDDFQANCGGGFIDYMRTLDAALQEYRPKFEWLPWRFNRAPPGIWKHSHTRKRYMQWLGDRLGFKNEEQWYAITSQDFYANCGSSLLVNHYGGSPSAAVMKHFKEYPWREWLFSSGVPRNFWQSKQNRRRYLAWLGETLGYRSQEDWYEVSQELFASHYGSGLLSQYYRGSPEKALRDLLPNVDFKPWLFNRVERGYWSKIANVRAYLGWLGEKLGFTTLDDWYKVTQSDFVRNRGGSLLNLFGGSHIRLLAAAFPKHKWVPWLFVAAPNGFWQSKKNQKAYLEWLGRRLGYSQPDDWYEVTVEDFRNHGGHALIRAYGSYVHAVKALFPRHDWCEWKFQNHRHFWDDAENRRRYMGWLGEQLGYRRPEDWYQVSQRQFRAHGGDSMLQLFYNSSPIKAVMDFLPDYDWEEWQFTKAPIDFWSDEKKRRRYFAWLAKKQGFSKPEDWYQVTAQDFQGNGGRMLLIHYGGVSQCVMANIPFAWQQEEFAREKKMQKRLYRIVKEYHADAVFDYKHPDLRFRGSGRKMEIDVWIPSLQIGFEYQDESHFSGFLFGEEAFRTTKLRDAEKRRAARKHGLTIIEVTCKKWQGDRAYVEKIIKTRCRSR